MNDIKWIKICTDIFDDEKILLIETMPEPDSLIVIWFKLLCLAGKQNNNGVFVLNNEIPYTEEMLAAIFRRPINTVRLAIKTFQKYGMIQIIDNVLTIPNWEKHQNVDKLNEIRESNRQRVARYREKQKTLLESTSEKVSEKPDKDVTLPVTLPETLPVILPVTLRNALDKDIDKDIDKDKEKKKRKKETNVSFDDFPILNNKDFIAKWELWKAYKKERKEKFTDSTQKLQLGKLTNFAKENGIDYALKVIDQSIEQGWQGLFPLKANSNNKNSNTKGGNSKYDSIAIRN